MKRFVALGLLLAALAAPGDLSAESAASASLRGKMSSLTAVASWPDPARRADGAAALWWGWGAWDRVAEESVGRKVWSELAPLDRDRLARLLSDLAALNWLRRAREPGYGMDYLREESAGGQRIVVTRVRSGGASADVRWVLMPGPRDAWNLADVVTEGASLVSTQRSSFARILERGGTKRLFARLETRREELRAAVAR